MITGVSIGHRIRRTAVQRVKAGARKLTKTEICEVSLVTIPANANATIRSRQIARGAAAAGEKSMATQTAAEHVQNIENKRAAHVARMGEIMKVAADDNRTLATRTKRRNTTAWRCKSRSFDDDLVPVAQPGETADRRRRRRSRRWRSALAVLVASRCDRTSSRGSRWRGSSLRSSRRAMKAPTRRRTPSSAGTIRRRKSRWRSKPPSRPGTHDRRDVGEAAGQSGDHG